MTERCNNLPEGASSPIQAAFLKYEQALKRVIARITRSRDAANDIAQDVFLRVLAAERTTLIVNAKAYIFEAARNAALSERTRRTKIVVVAIEDALNPVVADSELSAEAVIMGQERLMLFCEAVDQLPPQCRSVFVMCKVQGKSHREIAASLGISESTIEKHVGTALARCAAYISHREQGPSQSVALVATSGRRMPR
jgi:RNA polymerase sigma-70 factor (ECF subfamily)